MTVNIFGDDTLDLWRMAEDHYMDKGDANVMLTFQRYPVCNQIMQEQRRMIEGGPQFTQNVTFDDNGTAEMTQPYAEGNLVAADLTGKTIIPWREMRAHYVTEMSEVAEAYGSGPDDQAGKLQDMVTTREGGMNGSLANMLERRFWQAPTSSDDELSFWGMQYWCPPITGAQVTLQAANPDLSRFRGGNPSGFSATANINADLAKWAKYRAWNDVWSNSTGDVAEADVDTMVGMTIDMDFQSPTIAAEFMSPAFDRFTFYAGRRLQQSLNRKARANNDSLGADLGKFAGAVVIKGIPVRYAPALDELTTYPLFGINHDYVKFVALRDMYFKVIRPALSPTRPTVMATWKYLQGNFWVKNRRYGVGRIDYVAAG